MVKLPGCTVVLVKGFNFKQTQKGKHASPKSASELLLPVCVGRYCSSSSHLRVTRDMLQEMASLLPDAAVACLCCRLDPHHLAKLMCVSR